MLCVKKNKTMLITKKKKHLANDRSCPAASAQGNNCKKMGHYSRVCRSGQARSVREIDLPEVHFRSFICMTH